MLKWVVDLQLVSIPAFELQKKWSKKAGTGEEGAKWSIDILCLAMNRGQM
jgi:hypothetical protein